MSENNSLFIYTCEDNGDGNNSVQEHPIIPFFSLVPLSEKFHWQTNDTCQLIIFWQAYFSLATKHDIPINWDGTQNSELQRIRTYTQFKNAISKKDNKGKLVLKSDIFPVKFIEYTPSFHRTIVNFIGQNDWDICGLTDEAFDANLITEFIKDTGYNIDQLVDEKKLYHNNNIRNDQFKNGTYVWFRDSSNNVETPRAIENLISFFKRKLDHIKAVLEKANFEPNKEDHLYNFSNVENRNKAKAVLSDAGISTESFDLIFNDYDNRLALTDNISECSDFIHDFAEYLTFQSFCGNYFGLESGSSDFGNPLYLLQLIFTQIMLDHLDEFPEIRKQIFDNIVKVRDFLLNYIGAKCYIWWYDNRYHGPQPEAYKYFTSYNPTENPIQYIANSILPEGMKMTDEKFDSFLKHINYIYTALTNLSPEDSVTRLTLWTIPPDLDKRFGFIRDGVFCRPLFDVVEKYNSLQQDESAKIPITDLKPLPQNCRIITYEEYQQLTSAQEPEHSTSDSSTPSSFKTESSSDENIIIPVKRECIKISGTTLTTFGILALALGIAAQACSFGIPNPISIALMATGGTLIAAGSGMLIYRVYKNKQEDNQALNFEIAHNNGNDIQDNDEQNLSCNDRQPFSERIENSQEQAQNLPQNQPGNPQPNLEHQVL